MDRAELEKLLSSSGQELLAKLSPNLDMSDILRLVTALRDEGYEPGVVAAVLNQVQLRRRARKKLGPIADKLFYTEAGLEQATRLKVAAHHAERFRTAGSKRIGDLSAGLGIDSLAMAGLGLSVTSVERDEVTAALAAYNLAAFPSAQVIHAAAELQDLTAFDALWFDPSRRSSAKRSDGSRHKLRLEEYSPPLEFVFSALRARGGGVKLGPDFPLAEIPEDCEAEWVSDSGDLVELTLWFGRFAKHPGKRVALLTGETGMARYVGVGGQQTPAKKLGSYIYEPDPALIRSGLMGDLAREFGLHPTASKIAYLTGDRELESPWLRGFKILEVLSTDEREIARRLRELEIGQLEVKKRGVELDPEKFRLRLKLKGEGAATLVVTRVGSARLALLCQPLR